MARDSYVIDNAHLLSPATVTLINAKVSDFNAQAHKEVVVDIEPSFTGTPAAAEERAFAQHQVNGVLIFIAKSPKTIAVIPDRVSAHFFPSGTTAAIRQAIASAFNSGDFNGGVNNGVDLTLSHIAAISAEPAQHDRTRRRAPTVRNDTGGGFNMSIIWWLIALAVIFFIVRGIFRAIAGPRMMPPGYGGGPMGPDGRRLRSGLRRRYGGGRRRRRLLERHARRPRRRVPRQRTLRQSRRRRVHQSAASKPASAATAASTAATTAASRTTRVKPTWATRAPAAGAAAIPAAAGAGVIPAAAAATSAAAAATAAAAGKQPHRHHNTARERASFTAASSVSAMPLLYARMYVCGVSRAITSATNLRVEFADRRLARREPRVERFHEAEQTRGAFVVTGARVHLREHEQTFAHEPHRVLEHEPGDDVAADAVGRFEIAANQFEIGEIDEELARRAVAFENRDRFAFVAHRRIEIVRVLRERGEVVQRARRLAIVAESARDRERGFVERVRAFRVARVVGADREVVERVGFAQPVAARRARA